MKGNGLHGLLRDLKKLNLAVESSIEQLEKTLQEDRDDRSKSNGTTARFTESELKAEWQRLRDENHDLSRIEEPLNEFVSNKTKAELKQFIRVNELPIATKESRREIARQLAQLLVVGATVRGR
jgi:hypothetical protein